MLTGADLHETHTLDDGTEVLLRHIRPEDADQLRRAYQRLSSVSRYGRFQGVMKELSPSMVRYLTEVDGHDHVAIVATHQDEWPGHETGLGVARFIRSREDPTLAEVALTVADEAQHKGLGRILGVAIARAARERGIHRLSGPILSENLPIRHLLEDVGAELRTQPDGTTLFVVDLDPPPPVPSGARLRFEEIVRKIVSAFAPRVA